MMELIYAWLRLCLTMGVLVVTTANLMRVIVIRWVHRIDDSHPQDDAW